MNSDSHHRNGSAQTVLAPSRFPSPRPSPLYVFSGVRPSSGAETQGEPLAFGQSDPLERADVAAAEDGRTPLNTYTPQETEATAGKEMLRRISATVAGF
jgi:hypothetical protein